MGKIFLSVIEWGVSSGLLRFLKGMGLTLVSFALLNELIQRLLASASNNFGMIGGLGANALGLSGFDTALAIVAGAIITHVYLKTQSSAIKGIQK